MVFCRDTGIKEEEEEVEVRDIREGCCNMVAIDIIAQQVRDCGCGRIRS